LLDLQARLLRWQQMAVRRPARLADGRDAPGEAALRRNALSGGGEAAVERRLPLGDHAGDDGAVVVGAGRHQIRSPWRTAGSLRSPREKSTRTSQKAVAPMTSRIGT